MPPLLTKGKRKGPTLPSGRKTGHIERWTPQRDTRHAPSKLKIQRVNQGIQEAGRQKKKKRHPAEVGVSNQMWKFKEVSRRQLNPTCSQSTSDLIGRKAQISVRETTGTKKREEEKEGGKRLCKKRWDSFIKPHPK